MSSPTQPPLPIDTSHCTLQTCPLSAAQIQYLPSVGGNSFFVAWFALLCVLQIFLGFRHRTWGFLAGLFCGLVLEIVGYASRLKLHSNPFSSGPFLTYLVALTIAPAFLSFAIYLCLARVVVVYGRHISPIPPSFYTLFFVVLDICCLILQASGAAMTQNSPTPDKLKRALHILKAGLALQVASLVLFILLSAEFAFRVYRARGRWSTEHDRLWKSRFFHVFLGALGLAAICILIRSSYRVAELKNGVHAKGANKETEFMVLEGAMIALAGLALTLCHPGAVFREHWQLTDFPLFGKGRGGRRDPRIPMDTLHAQKEGR